MTAVIVTTYKTRKAAENFAADLASMDDGQYWNGREHIQVGTLNYRAIKQDGVWLVIRDWCESDQGRAILTINN